MFYVVAVWWKFADTSGLDPDASKIACWFKSSHGYHYTNVKRKLYSFTDIKDAEDLKRLVVAGMDKHDDTPIKLSCGCGVLSRKKLYECYTYHGIEMINDLIEMHYELCPARKKVL